jgi:hypothetical protein
MQDSPLSIEASNNWVIVHLGAVQQNQGSGLNGRVVPQGLLVPQWLRVQQQHDFVGWVLGVGLRNRSLDLRDGGAEGGACDGVQATCTCMGKMVIQQS